MFKRIIWFGSGVASGVAGSSYVRRKVRQQVERFTPDGIKKQAVERSTERVEQVRTDLTAYLRDGRELLHSLGGSRVSESSAQRRRDAMRAVPDREEFSG